MAYKVIILYRLYMPSYVLGTFTEYPCFKGNVFLIADSWCRETESLFPGTNCLILIFKP